MTKTAHPTIRRAPRTRSATAATPGVPQKIITIGAYGFKEPDFFKALQDAGVDTFCDIRARRGVRGPEYAFANSQRLQAHLRELGMRYFHLPELAPSQALRKQQAAADQATHVPRRQRAELAPDFITGYERECLEDFNAAAFLQRVGTEARVLALFCVERTPAACHRSLLAERLHRDLAVPVEHLTPS
jgi:uncharacterized protein (DUF488 family)